MLSTANGIKEVKVDLNGKEGVIQYVPNLITPKEIVEQICDMGFEGYVKTVNGKLMKKGNSLIKKCQVNPILFLFVLFRKSSKTRCTI